VAAAVQRTIRRLRAQVIYAGLVSVALALVVALGLSQRISGPLHRMRRLAGEMAAGDFSQRLEMKSSDEVGELGRSFDSLADSLQETLDQLQQEQARLRGILASVAEGIIAVDTEGAVTMINPQAAMLLGADQERALGRSVGELGLPEEVSQRFSECLCGSRLCSVEFQLPNPHRHLVLQVAPLRARESGRGAAVAVVRDVTAARRLDEMRRQFITDASHEIKTPLTAVGGFAAAIAEGVAADAQEQKRCASLIVREVERLNRLVNDLLDLSRIESGAVELTFEEVDLLELISSAVEAFQAQAREKDIEVEMDIPSDLPWVRADGDRIYQVLVNLISNALRFSQPGCRIAIAAECTDGQVRVEVRDTGPGIPADQLPYIWERFHRADTARSRQDGGTGLGLAIVRSIVEAHGGSVSAQSVLGEGATFIFTLPMT
jgi:two-component system sensor histidine kinase ResE